jgi:hypothetical protein
MAGKSRLSRSMAFFRDLGYLVEKVEYWNPWDKKTYDLFNIIDAVGIGHNEILGIQSCTGSDFAAHDRKILASEAAQRWVAGGKLVLIGWRKVKVKRGGKAERWSPRLKWYLSSDFK